MISLKQKIGIGYMGGPGSAPISPPTVDTAPSVLPADTPVVSGVLLTATTGAYTAGQGGALTKGFEWVVNGAVVSTAATYTPLVVNEGDTFILREVVSEAGGGTLTVVIMNTTVDYTAPIAANALADQVLTVDVAMTPLNIAADFTGQGLTIALQSGTIPTGLTFNGTTLSGTPTVITALGTLVFRATNPDGEFVDTAFDTTITSSSNPPIAGSFAPFSGVQGGGPHTVDLSTGFTGGAVVSYTSNQAWATVSGSTLTIDDVLRTSEVVNIIATNADGSANVNMTVSIAASGTLSIATVPTGSFTINTVGAGTIEITFDPPSIYAGTYGPFAETFADVEPINIVSPDATGLDTLGATKTAVDGLWAFNSTNGVPVITKQWFSGTNLLVGETAETHLVSALDISSGGFIEETATNGGGVGVNKAEYMASDGSAISEFDFMETTATLYNVDIVNGASGTFTAMNIGVAQSDRKIILIMHLRKSVAPDISVTIGGIAATQIVMAANTSSGRPTTVFLQAAVPLGTTADVVITNNSASLIADCSCALVRVIKADALVMHDTATSFVIGAQPTDVPINTTALNYTIAANYVLGTSAGITGLDTLGNGGWEFFGAAQHIQCKFENTLSDETGRIVEIDRGDKHHAFAVISIK